MGRLHSLDGLRGLAALLVFFHHILLTVPLLAEPYLGKRATEALPYALSYTPLHIFWEGQAAVYVFFVLSGVVLTLPVLKRGREFSWTAYYPQRLLRLYIPVWAAVVIGIGWLLLVPRNADSESMWLQSRAVDPSLPAVLKDLTLLFGHGGIVSPLWSLRWEIWFSLLLPVFTLLAIRLMRFRWLIAAVSITATTVGSSIGSSPLKYPPMFMLGAVMATALSKLTATDHRTGNGRGAALVLRAVFLLLSPWLIRNYPNLDFLVDPLEGVAAIGALLAVYCALAVPFARKFLETKIMLWFGMISFSLYLVHEPVVITSARIFGDQNLVLAALVAICVAIPLAFAFYRLVEVPSHRLARLAGDGLRTRFKKKPNNDVATPAAT